VPRETPAARRIKRKILIAMTLTAFLPLLVVATCSTPTPSR